MYVVKALLLYALWKGAQELWRTFRPRLICQVVYLPYPNQRRWSIPADHPRRQTDPDRIKVVELPRCRVGYPVVHLGIRGVMPIIGKRS